jgi:hypothetical protein
MLRFILSYNFLIAGWFAFNFLIPYSALNATVIKSPATLTTIPFPNALWLILSPTLNNTSDLVVLLITGLEIGILLTSDDEELTEFLIDGFLYLS